MILVMFWDRNPYFYGIRLPLSWYFSIFFVDRQQQAVFMICSISCIKTLSYSNFLSWRKHGCQLKPALRFQLALSHWPNKSHATYKEATKLLLDEKHSSEGSSTHTIKNTANTTGFKTLSLLGPEKLMKLWAEGRFYRGWYPQWAATVTVIIVLGSWRNRCKREAKAKSHSRALWKVMESPKSIGHFLLGKWIILLTGEMIPLPPSAVSLFLEMNTSIEKKKHTSTK